ncbi:Uncharacterised protein [Listeria newyorkensis]|nr:Uncharacterised protein [Listeria newyorkensis]
MEQCCLMPGYGEALIARNDALIFFIKRFATRTKISTLPIMYVDVFFCHFKILKSVYAIVFDTICPCSAEGTVLNPKSWTKFN